MLGQTLPHGRKFVSYQLGRLKAPARGDDVDLAPRGDNLLPSWSQPVERRRCGVPGDFNHVGENETRSAERVVSNAIGYDQLQIRMLERYHLAR